MRVAITGAGGQLGRALTETETDHDLLPLGRESCDVTDLLSVRAALRESSPEIVLNAAAWTDVDGAESDPSGAYRGNALGPRNLAVATAELGVPLVHISTDYVFPGTGERPYHEFDETGPASVYGKSKLAGEDAVRALNPRHYVVRTSWLYHSAGRNFPKTILRLAEREEVRVVDDQRGSPTWAPHLAEALLRLIVTDAFGTWHLAGSGDATWCELTRELYRRMGIATPVVPVTTAEFPRPAPRPAYSVLGSLQSPHIELPPWEEGLDRFVAAARSDRLTD